LSIESSMSIGLSLVAVLISSSFCILTADQQTRRE
jgi:hypothetical protein